MKAQPGRFRRVDRLLAPRDFERVARDGVRWRSRYFVLLVAAGSAQAPKGSRQLGITVSRRVGSAVVRNRVKRQVREWFRRVRTQFSPGTAVVVIARPPVAGLSVAEVRAALGELAAQARGRQR